jgi:hypothetical protein
MIFWAVKELGLSETLLAPRLGTTQPNVSRAKCYLLIQTG